jgi:restriction system protein
MGDVMWKARVEILLIRSITTLLLHAIKQCYFLSKMRGKIMIENKPTNVFIAFKKLLEEIETEIDLTNKVGSKAIEERDYEGANEAIRRSTQIIVLRDKLVALRNEWETLTASEQNAEEEIIHAELPNIERLQEEVMHTEPSNIERLQREQRTAEVTYYQFILEALHEAGGGGKVSDILENVEHAMQDVLKQVDYQPLVSDPETLRWRNTAQWARNAMVKKGLLRSDSPRGIWEITDAGIALYEQQK